MALAPRLCMLLRRATTGTAGLLLLISRAGIALVALLAGLDMLLVAAATLAAALLLIVAALRTLAGHGTPCPSGEKGARHGWPRAETTLGFRLGFPVGKAP